jgi:hypothetical protein
VISIFALTPTLFTVHPQKNSFSSETTVSHHHHHHHHISFSFIVTTAHLLFWSCAVTLIKFRRFLPIWLFLLIGLGLIDTWLLGISRCGWYYFVKGKVLFLLRLIACLWDVLLTNVSPDSGVFRRIILRTTSFNRAIFCGQVDSSRLDELPKSSIFGVASPLGSQVATSPVLIWQELSGQIYAHISPHWG